MKKFSRNLVILAILSLSAACNHLTLTIHSFIQNPKQFDDRQLIVTVSEDIRDQWQTINKEILERFDVQAAGAFPLRAIRVNCLVYRVSETVDVNEIMQRLRADKRIDLVQVNQILASLQNSKTDTYSELSYGPKIIHSDLVHSIATGKSVNIAVIDTGADTDHIDLNNHINKIYNFVEGGMASFKEDKHGTAVTGVIGAINNNGIGINGIAPNANLSVYKACWYAESTTNKAHAVVGHLPKRLMPPYPMVAR